MTNVLSRRASAKASTISTGTSRRNERKPRSLRECGSGGAPETAGRTAPGGAVPTLSLAFDLVVLDRRRRLLHIGNGRPGPGGVRGDRVGLGGRLATPGLRSLLVARLLLRRAGGKRRKLGLVEPPLLDARPLAAALAQVVELGPAHPTPRDDLELRDRWRVDGERALHTHPEGDLPDGEGLVQAPALTADHHALEDLHPLATGLHHPDVHAHGVARPER